MEPSHSPGRLPAAAVKEFEKLSKTDWQERISLTRLLERVNQVVATFIPSPDGPGSGVGRVKRVFTERNFRHYQTRGCIDPPIKDGRLGLYGFRQFVQALLVRRLLWEKVSADQIAAMLVGRTTEEMEQMFLGGVEVVLKGKEPELDSRGSVPKTSAEVWKRLPVFPGIELHLLGDSDVAIPKDLSPILARIEEVLNTHRR